MSFIVSYARAHIRSAPKSFIGFFFSARYAAAPGFTPRSILGSRILRRVRRGRTHGHRPRYPFRRSRVCIYCPLILSIACFSALSRLVPATKTPCRNDSFFFCPFSSRTLHGLKQNRTISMYLTTHIRRCTLPPLPPSLPFFLTHGGYTPPFILSYLPVCVLLLPLCSWTSCI